MTMFLAPYTAIADIDGSPLDAGFLFFGESGKNPELFPIEVFWDADFTVPAAQPIRTRNGYPIRSGSPCKIYLKQAEHSLVVKNKNLSAILVEMNNKGISSSLLVRPNGDTVETSLTNIDAELNDKQQQIDEKPSQQYVDEELDLKAPKKTTYTKLEVDSALSTKAPQATTYTKAEVDTTFAAYVGGRKAFTTLALAQAGQSTLTANTVVDVTNDPDPAKNGTYQWNGTTLTKSAYDPLTQAKIAITQQAGFLSNLRLTTRSFVANGATVSDDTLTVPIGATASTSYVTKLVELNDSTNIAGKTVKLTAYFKKSANFASSGITLIHNILTRVNGVTKSDQEVVGSTIVEDIDSTTIKVSADYIVEAAASLQVGVTLIVRASSPASSQLVTLQALTNVSLFSDSATMSEIADGYLKYDLALNNNLVSSLQTNVNLLTSKVEKSAEIEVDSSNLTHDLRELNGATLLPNGLNFPTGQTGLTSFIRLKVLANLLKNYSFTAKLSAVVTTSDDFFEKFGLININIAKYATAGGAITVNEGKNSSNLQKINKNKYVVSATFDSTAGYEQYALWFQVLSSSDTSAVRSVVYDKVYLQILSVNSADYVAQNTLVAQYKADTLKALIPAPPIDKIQQYRPNYIKTVKVKANGGGDFTTIESAFAAHGGGANFYNRVKYEIYEGNYTPYNQYIPKYADLIGVGKRDNIHIFCHMPDNTNPSIIETSQPLWMNETSKIKGLKITAKNARYPLHSDSMNSDKKAVQEVEDCYIEHFGNDAARAWQAANGGNPSAVRTQHYALGCGSHADWVFFSRRTVWKSSNRPFYIHNQREFAAPSYAEIDGGAVICTSNDSDAILMMTLGSGQVCNLVIKNNPTVRGRLVLTASSSLSNVVDNQIADQNAEIDIEIQGNSIPAYSENSFQCLALRSAMGASSSVRVSGTAADAIFGKYPDYQDGAVNLVGKAISRFVATATNPNVTATIGTRLGDCSTTAKTLSIVFDNSVNKTITLNENYTAMSNANIITTLNAALADATRSFALEYAYQNKAHIKQTAHEAMILNTSSVAILKGAGVKQSTNMNCGETANGDTGFIGVALENILPNQIGRVQKSGYICRRMLWTGHTFVVGDFGTVNTTGSILKSTTSGVLKCVDVIADEPVFEIE